MNLRNILCTLCFLLFAPYTLALGSGLEVSPLLIDENAQKRDIITKDITVTNDTETTQVLYATVNEVSVDTAGELKEFVSPAMDDRTTAITSWLEISRTRIVLGPGVSTTTPLTIRIHPQAKPGAYHAFIGFVATNNRPEAERIAMSGNAKGVIVKVNLEEQMNHSFQIDSFLVDRFVLHDDQRTISVAIKNDGETDIAPDGEIIFYNSRGEEVSSAFVNQQAQVVAAGETKNFEVAIPFQNELGKFKANVRLGDGVNQQALLFDTTQFFMIPPKLALAVGVGILLFSLLLTYLLHRAFRVELHDDDEGSALPLYVRNDREHHEKDHDIDLKK